MSLRGPLIWASVILALLLALSIKSIVQETHVVTKKITIKIEDPHLRQALFDELANATSNVDKIMIVKKMALAELKERHQQHAPKDGLMFGTKIVPCDELKWQTYDMMRQIDCKPLSDFSTCDKAQYLGVQTHDDADWQVDRIKRYVMQMSLDHDGKLETVLPSFKPDPSSPYHSLTSGPPGSYRIYPLKQDFARQSIRKIFKASAMDSTHGFVNDFVNFGFHGVMSSDKGLVCDANALFAFNTTEADLPDSPDMFEYLVSLIENGGLISLQDGRCSVPTSMSSFAMHLETTFIHRNEFPYVKLDKKLYSSPDSNLLNFEASSGQTKRDAGETSAQFSDDYLTTFKLKLASEKPEVPNTNFVHTVTKPELDIILKRLVARYPDLAHLLQGGLSADDLYEIATEMIQKVALRSGKQNQDSFNYV